MAVDGFTVGAAVGHLPSETGLRLRFLIISIRRWAEAGGAVLTIASVAWSRAKPKRLVDVILVEDLTEAALVRVHRRMHGRLISLGSNSRCRRCRLQNLVADSVQVSVD